MTPQEKRNYNILEESQYKLYRMMHQLGCRGSESLEIQYEQAILALGKLQGFKQGLEIAIDLARE